MSKRKRIPATIREAVFKRDGGACVRYGRTERLGLDHIVPVSRGGTDEIENLRVYCLGCNAAKNNRDDDGKVTRDKTHLLNEVIVAAAEHAQAISDYKSAFIDAYERGYSFAEIACAAGVSRQAARKMLTNL